MWARGNASARGRRWAGAAAAKAAPEGSCSAQPAALEYAGPLPSAEAALAALAGPVARWFRQRYGEPTAIQRLAWPPLALGRHLLVSAPCG